MKDEKSLKTKLPVLESKTRIYRLKRETPLTYFLRSKGDTRKPLLYFDRENQVNRPLRYASNQRTPFEDDQDNNPVLEPIVFENGMLRVPETNPLLQLFLNIHPGNGVIFEEIDKDAEAQAFLAEEAILDEAVELARNYCSDIDVAEAFYKLLFNKSPRQLTSSEIKADIRRKAKADPDYFLRVAESADLDFESNINTYLSQKLINWRNGKKDLFFNLPNNKKKIMSVPEGDDPMEAAIEYFDSDEGLEAVKEIERVASTL